MGSLGLLVIISYIQRKFYLHDARDICLNLNLNPSQKMTFYQERTYRRSCLCPHLVSFNARVKETDLWILADQDLTAPAVQSISRHRRVLEKYLEENPQWGEALTPLPPDPYAPLLVQQMLNAGQNAGTGPMAAVAGAIAQAVGRDLLEASPQVVVENGGDLFIASNQDLTIGLWAGDSPLSGKIGLSLPRALQPTGLATSSGTVGHSLSLGKTDAATVLAKDPALADAVATAMGNLVIHKKDLKPALNWAAGIKGVRGALLIAGENLAAWGEIELVRT